MKRLFTIGYRGLSYEALVTELRRHGVEGLLDVRAVPWSQDPRYTSSALLAFLAGRGIDYLDGKKWGNPHRDLATLEPFRLHLQQHPELVSNLGMALREDHRTICLLCVCPSADRCHRGMLCAALLETLPGDFEVYHLPRAEVLPALPLYTLEPLAPLPPEPSTEVKTMRRDYPWSNQ